MTNLQHCWSIIVISPLRHYQQLGECYFLVVFVAIIFAMLRKQYYRTTRIFFLCSAGLLGLPIVNAIANQYNLWQGLALGQTWVWAEVSFFVSGLVLILISVGLAKHRAVEPRSQQKPS